MRQRTWNARKDKLLKEEALQPESWWWLSFADETGFKGGILIKARGFFIALGKTHFLGINPGGEAVGAQIPEGTPIDEQFANRLLSKREIEENMGGARKMQ